MGNSYILYYFLFTFFIVINTLTWVHKRKSISTMLMHKNTDFEKPGRCQITPKISLG